MHGALNGHEVVDTARHSHLAAELQDCAFKHSNQGAGTELFGNRGNVLHALRLAESANEASALPARAADQQPLRNNRGPGEHAEGDEQEKDGLGDWTGLKHEIDDFAADNQQEDGRKGHWFRENPSQDYRPRRWRTPPGYRIGQPGMSAVYRWLRSHCSPLGLRNWRCLYSHQYADRAMSHTVGDGRLASRGRPPLHGLDGHGVGMIARTSWEWALSCPFQFTSVAT